MPSWMIYVIDVLVVVVVFMSWAWWQRSRYNKIVSPSKDAPLGKMMGDFWPETGMRYKVLLPVEVNGIEVKSPKGHQCPRYFFDKQSTWQTKYPEAPFLNLKFLQVDVPIVSWMENNPEPINPYGQAPVATSALIDSLRDNDFAAFAIAADKEIQSLQRELASALANSLNKRYVYILLGAAVIAAGIAAVLAFQNINLLDYIKSGLGM